MEKGTKGTFVEPVQNLSTAHVFESGQQLAARIKEHGFQNLASQGFLTAEFDERSGAMSLQEPLPNLAKSMFEPTNVLQSKIEKQGLDNMIAKGYLMQV